LSGVVAVPALVSGAQAHEARPAYLEIYETVHGKGWKVILCLYVALELRLDKSWNPGKIELMKE